MNDQSQQTVWIDKHQAAKQLGVTERRVLKLAQDGKIKAQRQRNPESRQIAVMLNAGDVERLAYEMEHPQETATAVVPASKGSTAVKDVALVLESLGGLVALKNGESHQHLKPWLTIAEGSEYSGLPKSTILTLIGSGNLKAIDCGPRPGGRYRVRRVDLDALEGMNC